MVEGQRLMGVGIRLVWVGKLKEPFWRDAVAHYARRLEKYLPIEIREIAGGRDEEERISRALDGCRAVFLLDRCGEAVDSEGLAARLGQLRDEGLLPLGLAVGGADGFSEGFMRGLAKRVSFSKLTFPHELFRVLLLEQLYRAFTILRGEPYHLGH